MAITEYPRHGFCEILPPEIRAQIEMMAPEFLPETWPVRFVALISMLEDMAAKVAEADRPFVVNNWVIIVTGLLEHLPRDLGSPECLLWLPPVVQEDSELNLRVIECGLL